MTFRHPLPLALSATVLAVAVAGCGGNDTSTTTVTRTATITQTVTAPATATTPPQTTTQPSTTPATAPLTLQQAEQVLDGRGFATLTERDWRPDQTLKVLLGVRRGVSRDGAQQAFFFAGDRFIGTDTRDPSGRIEVADQADDEIALTYALYRPGDSIEQPSGGSATVTYVWAGARLTPRDPIPSSDPGAALSRR